MQSNPVVNLVQPAIKKLESFIQSRYTDEKPLVNITMLCKNGSAIVKRGGWLENGAVYDTEDADHFFDLAEQARRARPHISLWEKQSYNKVKFVEEEEDDLLDEDEEEDEDELMDDLDKDKQEVVSKVAAKVIEVVDESGIMIDFDIISKNDTPYLDETNKNNICSIIADAIVKYVDFQKAVEQNEGTYNIFFAITQKPKPVLITKKSILEKYGKCYKDGYHILVPNVLIPKFVKKLIVEYLQKDAELIKIFSDKCICNPISEIVDSNCTHVPVMFPGFPKVDKDCTVHPAYELRNIYTAKVIHDGKGARIRSLTSDHGLNIDEFDAKDSKTNWCAELSLTLPSSKTYIQKRVFQPLPQYFDARIKKAREENNIIDEEELGESDRAVRDLIYTDPDAKLLYNYLSIMSPKRARSYENWRNVIYALANTDARRYKPLAIWWSQQHPAIWKNNGLKALNSLWDNAANMYSSVSASKVTMGTIKYWARCDNPEKYKRVSEECATTKILKIVINAHVRLNDMDYVDIFKSVCADQHVYCPLETPGSKISGEWYVFADTKNTNPHNPVIWKWVRDVGNLLIMSKLTNELSKLFRHVADEIRSRANAETDKDRKAKLDKKANICMDAYNNVRNKTGVNNIVTMAKLQMYDLDFLKQLDKNEQYVGVKNGVLDLKNMRLIDHHHNIKVSRFINAIYKPYDPKDPYVIEVTHIIRSLFLESEQDMFDFILSFYCAGLDFRKKSPMLLVLGGRGANGKSTLISYMLNLFGSLAKPVPMSKFTKETGNPDSPDSILSSLEYARIVTACESNKSDTLNMQVIKIWISNDKASVRDLQEKQREFDLRIIITIATNYPPIINCSDYGTWRRIWFYPFQKTFVEKPNPKNPLELKMEPKYIEEYPTDPNILTALLSILTYYYQTRYVPSGYNLNKLANECKTLVQTSKEYRHSQDKIYRFMQTRLVHTGDDTKIPMETLRAKYCDWYKKNIGYKDVPSMAGLDQDFEQSSLGSSIRTISEIKYVVGWAFVDLEEVAEINENKLGFKKEGPITKSDIPELNLKASDYEHYHKEKSAKECGLDIVI